MTNGSRPNVIFVLTDDQGFADLGSSGNPWIRTPHLDRFHGESVRFTDFHVSPLCTPTRGALMTGHRPVRNGAWATCWGRSLLKADEVTMADVFKAGGYRTGMFGKWHLGDNYPYRPQDRGFDVVVAHKGGGVGNTPDFWGNNYFDDTYFANGEPTDYAGYCTDVWFKQATTFIRENADRPFFAYIATNAPHSPYLVEERYAAPYRGNDRIPHPAFYGMITNIDENFGKLRATLRELGIEDNTILVFMTDNGSSGGCELDDKGFVTRGYNAGLRGRKASRYDGGHRAPWFVRWPDGSLGRGRDVTEMCLHVDVLPTLIELCDLQAPEDVAFDGTSVAALLRGEADRLPGDRIHHVDLRQWTEMPDIWDGCVMTRDWRLVHGKELYDIKADPGQEHDVSAQHPDVVRRLREAQERWWEEVMPRATEYAPISLGADAENPTRLGAMDVLGDVAWNQNQVASAQKSCGTWTVKIEEPGRYRFALRRWPGELDLPLDAGISQDVADRLAPYQEHTNPRTIHPVRARLALFEREHAADVTPGQREVVFELDLPQAGDTRLDAWFADARGEEQGAYYVYVERL
jgi:arylsulfatase A-like enzyme